MLLAPLLGRGSENALGYKPQLGTARGREYQYRGITQVQQNQVAVIGCGAWGKNLVRNFSALGVLAMVCDTTPTGRATAQALAPQAAIETSVEAALRAPVAGLI